ncbi:MAG: hypothetical protein ACJ8AW_26595 [Rhodopila sp.]
MPTRRFHLQGLFAVLLALMVQLIVGASVPRLDPFAQITGVETLCHATDDGGSVPARAPTHPVDCLLCPFCIAAHPQILLVLLPPDLMLPRIRVVQRVELPPPSRAPPFRPWSPTQPRAPPFIS